MAIFDDEKVYIVKDGTVLLHGYKYEHARLYMVNITGTENVVQPKLNIIHMQKIGGIHNFSNNAYKIKKKQDLISHYRTCCFSPVFSTWLQAINMLFSTWPGLTITAVRKYLPKSMATAKGHMQ